MTKRYDEPIEVTPDPGDVAAPLSFSWRGRRYDVDQLLSTWREAGEWWEREGVREREFHRVVAHPANRVATGELDADGFLISSPGAVYDIYRDRTRDDWRLARVWD